MTATCPPLDTVVRLHPVMVALSKARASAWLLDELANGESAPPTEVEEWLEDMALTSLKEALGEAGEAFVKTKTLEEARRDMLADAPRAS